MRKTPAARRFGVLTLCVLVLTVLIYGLWQGLLGAHAASAPLPSTIFLDTTAATFTITTVGASGSIAYSVTDFSGATVGTGQAGVSYGQAALTLPREQDGYYVLHVVDHTGPSSASQSIPFAIVAPFTTPADSPFGVSVHFIGSSNAVQAQLAATMGAKMIREDAAWNLIEKSPGQYTYSGFDPYMRVIQQDNIDPLLILDYSNSFYDNGQTPYDSSGLNAFANYARSVVAHYGPQLKAVEVYNEYNGTSSTGPCARKPACYAEMLRVSIRPSNPSVRT